MAGENIQETQPETVELPEQPEPTPQEQQPTTEEDVDDRLGKAETPPPTYEDACHFILTGRHPLSNPPPASPEPPPSYPDYSGSSYNPGYNSQYVDLSSSLHQQATANVDVLDGQQETMVIASEEDFPRTCSICKQIAAYLVAIFWISISSIQLLMRVGVAHHYHFEKFLYGGTNRAYGNAMFMFWMTALFANIVLLFGIINKNR